MKKQPFTATFTTRKEWFGGKNERVDDGLLHQEPQSSAVNVFFNERGLVNKRRGWRYFGDMVHELWRINKIAQKSGLSSDITVRIPLPGRKPIFKKTT